MEMQMAWLGLSNPDNHLEIYLDVIVFIFVKVFVFENNFLSTCAKPSIRPRFQLQKVFPFTKVFQFNCGKKLK